MIKGIITFKTTSHYFSKSFGPAVSKPDQVYMTLAPPIRLGQYLL
jgi:hypothetical protein